ncbi:MAG: MFS transporter [Deltaproteobacteria bacterium]|nr:MFS transporter [Deltaproteobacteria bacterium]
MFNKLLLHKNFKNYFLGDIISNFGNGISFMGAGWFIMQLTGKNADIGFLFIMNVLGGALVYPFIGAIVDRFDRKAIIITANCVRALFALLLAGLFFTNHCHPVMIYAFSALNGAGWAVFIPSSKSYLQEILDRANYLKGNSLVEISLQVGTFSSAAICGVLYKYYGFGWLLITSAVTLIISSVFLFLVNHPSSVKNSSRTSAVSEFKQGYAYLKNNSLVVLGGIVLTLPFVVTMSSNVVVIGYVNEWLKKGPVEYGIIDMFYGIGAFLSGLFTVTLARYLGRNTLIIGAYLISTLTLAALTINSFYVPTIIGMLLFGYCNSSIRIHINAWLMSVIPENMMGRCQSTFMFLSLIAHVGTMHAVGTVMDATGARFGYLFLAFVMLSGLIFAVFMAGRLSDSGNKNLD